MGRRKAPPVVTFRAADPLQDYYEIDGECFSVAKLIDDTKDLTPFELPLAGINLSDVIWDHSTVYTLAFHIKKVNAANLDYPIILDWNGEIADGRHRIIKALAEDRTTISAVRMQWKPKPDRVEKAD